MSATNEGSQQEFRRLYTAYREAWQRFCAEMEAWQSLSPDRASADVLDSARNCVREAEILYRSKRDQLAEYMFASARASSTSVRPADGSGVRTGDAAGRQTRQVQLEELAYRFWQEGGRRDGNADGDWYRAEAVLHE